MLTGRYIVAIFINEGYEMKLICWVDSDMKHRLQNEYLNDQLIFVNSFEEFTKAITNDALLIISASMFNDYDMSGFVYEVASFFKKLSNNIFHIFAYDKDVDAGLSIGVLARNKNVVLHIIFQNYNNTIQFHIDNWNIHNHF